MASEFDLDDEFALPTRVTRRGVKPAVSKPKVVDEFALDEPSAIAPRTPRRGPKKTTQEQTQDLFKPSAPSREFPSTFEIETGTAEVPTREGADEDEFELPPKEVINFDELVKPDNMATIKDYAEARFGNAGRQKEGESDEDYVKRWMTAMRQTEWNTTLNGVPELNWIYNAKKEDVLKAAKAHELYESVPDWYEKGGQPGIRPFAESAAAAISDPSSLMGFGVGAFARYKAARAGINVALKDRIKTVTAGAAVEGAVGVAATAVDAQRELELEKSLVNDKLDQEIQNLNSALEFGEIEEDQYNLTLSDIEQARVENESRNIDPTRVALGGAFSAVFGAIEAGSAFRKPKLSTKEDLEKVLASRTKTPEDVVTKRLLDAFDADMEDTLTKFDVFEGRQILDELSPQTVLTQAEVRKDINIRAINVARYILTIDPEFSQVKQRVASGQQKVSDAVKDVFMSIDSIDEDILDAALNKAGLTFKEFGQATRTTVADAASIMQGYSTLAKVLKKAVKLDPEAERLVERMYGKDQEITSAMGYIGEGIKRLERESKAFVVSSIATTVRNAYGSTAGITMDAATRILEGTIFAVGSATKAAARGGAVPAVKELGTGLNMMVRDAFNTLTYLTNAGITAEVTDKLLANNPKLQHTLFHALQETGTADLSRAAKLANTFNIAQDVYFRRAIFTASVERQMRRVGLDMYQVMADGKNIPTSILQNAADDALKGTFSYMPKPHKKGTNTMEAKVEGLANQFVRFFESVPGGSLAVTFPRFMTNAMAFQYRYSPLGAASGVQEMIMAAAKFSKDPDVANRLYREGLEKFSRGTVGTAAIYAAYKYRLDNQDTDWYNIQNEEGSTVDTRAVFPIGPYLAVGDFLAKMKLGRPEDANVAEMIEAIAGMKMPAGTQSTILNSLPELIAAEEGKEADRFQKGLGKLIGDFAGRFLQPAQPLFAYFDQFDEEAQTARDPNVLSSDDLLTESALNRVKVKVPGYKEELPEAVQYLRNEQETRVRAGEFLNLLTGVRVVPAVNKIEREFKELNLDPYTFYGASGDKTYDRTLITKSGPYIENFVGKLIDSDRYLNMTPAQRKIAITNNMQYALSIGRSLAQAELTMSDRDRVNKMTFYKLPQRDRKAINELYADNNEGRTLDEDKAYDQVYKYKALLSRYR
jgi:hypothetical protein